MKTHIAIGLLACAALACGARTAPARATGQGGIRASVKAQTAAGTLTGVHLSIAPAGIELDLALDPKGGAFGGFAFVPAGAQTLTAVAFVGPTRVGSGTATVTVADKVNTAVSIAILDETGAKPSPDHGPIVTSLAGPTAPGVGETVTLTASALDPDDASAAIAYAWSASCGGAFGTPGAASTTWTPAAAGPCTVSVVATSGGLSDRADLLVAVGGVTTCSDLVDVSAPVQTQWVSQPMPAPSGGAIVDGTYVLVSSIDYGGAPPPTGGNFEQVTIRIQGGRIEVADRTGAQSGTIAVVGPTSLEVDLTCPALQTMRLGYSADATSFTVFGTDGPTRVQVFARQGFSACTAVPDLSGPVEEKSLAQSPPTPTGGVIPDGTYALRARTSYTGAGGYEGGSGVFHRGMVRIDGSRVEHMGDDKRESGTFTTSGTTLTVNMTCPTADTGTMSYSVTGGWLTVFDAGDPNAVEVYELVPTRTVTGSFVTTYWSDSGKTSVAQPSPDGVTATALYVPDQSSGGFQAMPVTVAADGTFSVPGVPDGPYYVRTDGAVLVNPIITQFTTSSPTFPFVSVARPDVAVASQATPIALTMSGLDPWVAGDNIILAGMTSRTYARVQPALTPRMTAGATTYDGAFDWTAMANGPLASGLPDASKGDALFVYQRSYTTVGSGASMAEWRAAQKYARLDAVTVADGAGATLAVSLADPPATALVPADMRVSQFDALAPSVSPAARVAVDRPETGLNISVQAVPRSLGFDAPEFAVTALGWLQLRPGVPDTDYGPLSYGEFLGAPWLEGVQILATYPVSVTAPGATQPADYDATLYSWIENTHGAQPVTPGIGPVQAPTLNGADAFAPQSGVGAQPVLAWSPPALGSATGYAVTLFQVANAAGATAVNPMFTVKLYGATSFRVPPGALSPGQSYFAVVTAIQAPWDVLDGPQRPGADYAVPYHSADCVTALFTP